MAARDPYYAGAVRVVIDGVPIKLRRKPKPWQLKIIKKGREDFRTPQEKANARAREARDEIEAYAKALGISVPKAKALIDRHRLHVLENPERVEPLEYDL